MPDELRQYLAIACVGLATTLLTLGVGSLLALVRPRRGDTSRAREGLFEGMRIAERGLLPAPLARFLGWTRSRTLSVFAVDLDGGTGDAIVGLFSAPDVRRLARSGVSLVGDPREAAVLVVSGAIGPRGASLVDHVLGVMSHPRLVVAFGDAAVGGISTPTGHVALSDLVAVDLEIPGGAPAAEDLLAGLWFLAGSDSGADVAATWAAAASDAVGGGEPDLGMVDEAGSVGLGGSPLLTVAGVDAGSRVGAAHRVEGACHQALELRLERATSHDCLRSGLLRLDSASRVALPLVYAEALERLTGIAVSSDAMSGRILLLEASRVATALDDLAGMASLLGFPARASEARTIAAGTHQALQRLSGRIQIVVGGLLLSGYGAADDEISAVLSSVRAGGTWLTRFIAEVCDSSAVRRRVQGLGAFGGRDALAWGVSGVNARASGVPIDARAPDGRLVDPWRTGEGRVLTHVSGDVHARTWLRAMEGAASATTVERVAAEVRPAGSMVLPFDGRLPAESAGAVVEHPRGLMACSIVGDGSTVPWRVHVAGPSRAARGITAELLTGVDLGDVPLIVASMAVSNAEADR